jgi:hypothetical protein
MENVAPKYLAKPIFIIGFPVESDNSQIDSIRKSLEYKLNNEYHIITYKAQDILTVTFNVLNAINASDIEISDLIKLTKEEITLLQTQLENAK